jgi:hypothetical protein
MPPENIDALGIWREMNLNIVIKPSIKEKLRE